jgi:hypothetical protein
MSPQIRLMIAIRLSWLCKLGFLGKREKYIYMLRDVRRTHPYCTDPYRPYNNILEARKSRQAWARFSRHP